MATVDISLLGLASPIIVFLLFFIGGWGVLQTVDPFKSTGAGKNFYGLLAFLLAILLSLSSVMVQVVLSATPWLVFMILIGFFIMFFSMMFGVDQKSLMTSFWGKGWGWFITILIVVVLFSLGGALGPALLDARTPGSGSGDGSPTGPPLDLNEPVFDADGNLVPAGSGSAAGAGGSPGASVTRTGTATDDFGTNLLFTLFNPKVIGVLFLFVLGALTIVLINV
jgi:hypothetical protein